MNKEFNKIINQLMSDATSFEKEYGADFRKAIRNYFSGNTPIDCLFYKFHKNIKTLISDNLIFERQSTDENGSLLFRCKYNQDLFKNLFFDLNPYGLYIDLILKRNKVNNLDDYPDLMDEGIKPLEIIDLEFFEYVNEDYFGNNSIISKIEDFDETTLEFKHSAEFYKKNITKQRDTLKSNKANLQKDKIHLKFIKCTHSNNIIYLPLYIGFGNGNLIGLPYPSSPTPRWYKMDLERISSSYIEKGDYSEIKRKNKSDILNKIKERYYECNHIDDYTFFSNNGYYVFSIINMNYQDIFNENNDYFVSYAKSDCNSGTKMELFTPCFKKEDVNRMCFWRNFITDNRKSNESELKKILQNASVEYQTFVDMMYRPSHLIGLHGLRRVLIEMIKLGGVVEIVSAISRLDSIKKIERTWKGEKDLKELIELMKLIDFEDLAQSHEWSSELSIVTASKFIDEFKNESGGILNDNLLQSFLGQLYNIRDQLGYNKTSSLIFYNILENGSFWSLLEK